MSVNMQKLTNLGHLYDLGSRVVTAISPLSDTFKSAKVENNTVKFYTTTNPTANDTPVFIFNLGEEQFLDQTGTTFVDEFHFNSETYVGATDPNLEGKPVLVMALKATENGKSTLKYVFANLEKLIKTYESSNGSLKFNQFDVAVNISKDTDNALTLKDGGLYVEKTKTAVAMAAENDIPVFASDGTLQDTGLAVASNDEVRAMLDSVGLTSPNNSTNND